MPPRQRSPALTQAPLQNRTRSMFRSLPFHAAISQHSTHRVPHEERGSEAGGEGCLRLRHALLCARNLGGVARDEVVPVARGEKPGN